MAIVHIVMFQFRSSTKPTVVRDVCKRMLGLSTKCIHPTSQKPYIQLASGGKNNSPEGLQNGLTHAFVVNFENEADRSYYLDKDPAHQDFKASLKDVVEKVCVVDYEPNVF